jgi:coenzyme F420-reducing hydrogenase delta subunit/Pyruvate/2-oxoacid:ferredoxin oxidoreductase delta subunit
MRRSLRALEAAIRRLLGAADAAMNRLYGWRLNPLYHSGALVVALLVVLLVTGIYLTFFYRVGAPYDSVSRITGQVFLGRWIRGLHRYASDAVLIAAAVHAARMFGQGRSWGPRTVAWVSGLALVFLILIAGWTGYVMIWDVHGQALAVEGAKLLDVVPFFSEPIGRSFTGERPMPGAFFFLNLFAHIAFPIGLGVLLWIHVSRVARPRLLPPPRLMWGVVGLLLVLSVAWPMPMGPEANALRLSVRAPYDLLYSFWVPMSRALPAAATWAVGSGTALILLLIPVWVRPPVPARPAPSVVNERFCTGCEQCALDCPYDAISMVPREGGRGGLVARVDPKLCVSCGICLGSCAPMGVGPPQRTGREQLAEAGRFFASVEPGPADVVLIACGRGAGGVTGWPSFAGSPVFRVSCAGSLHTSVIEYFVRSGAGGVLVAACPARDCWNREGPEWVEERMYHDREAELRERVDRQRVRLTHAGSGEPDVVRQALEAFRAEIGTLEATEREEEIDLVEECHEAGEEAVV